MFWILNFRVLILLLLAFDALAQNPNPLSPTVTIIRAEAPDALVYEICDAILLFDYVPLNGIWNSGIHTALRLNDTLIHGQFFSFELLAEMIKQQECLTFSQNPTGLIPGTTTIQALICDEEKNCDFRLESPQELAIIEQNPFQIRYLDPDSFDTPTHSRQSTPWPAVPAHENLTRASFCSAPWDHLTPRKPSTPVQDAPPAVDTLILYAFSHSDGWREDNLLFFLAKGLLHRARYHFVLIASGAVDPAWRRLLDRVAAASPSFEWHQRPDRGRDVCAWHSVLRGWIRIRRRLSSFARYVLLNASARGPFPPSYYPRPWPEILLSLLAGGVHLAGASVFCACARPEPRPGYPCVPTAQLHVQGYALAFAGPALPLVLDLQAAVCALTGRAEGAGGLHAWSFELELTRRVLAAGGGAAVTQYLWAGVDLRDAAAVRRACADAVTPGGTGDPLHPGAYLGGDAHPLELVFFKTNRDVAPEALHGATRAALSSPAPWAVPPHVLCG
jgi:hypothetical protein